MNRNLLQEGLIRGMKKGGNSFLWMMKIVLPVSFFTSLFAWSGLIEYGDGLLKPLLSFINLPSFAALPLLMGMLTGLYGGIAAMVVLPLTIEEMTLIGIFLLIAHNLIQEGIIQAKSGINPFKATSTRIIMAVFTLWLLSPWFPYREINHTMTVTSTFPSRVSLGPALTHWFFSTAKLTVKAFFIIMFLLTVLELLKTSGWIKYFTSLLSPFLKLMGLDKNTSFLWITAIFFGLAYGGSVIVEESKEGSLSKEEIERLHVSIGLNHSLIEDPLLLVALGINPFWLYVPRLLIAAFTVQFLRLWQKIRN